mgnify:FL=1
MQTTSRIFMVRPASFTVNQETAVTNYFQQTAQIPDAAQSLALAEFTRYVDTLQQAGIDVHVFDDPTGTDTPDSLFPNNWLTLGHQGEAILYPMEAPNRRKERNPELIATLSEQFTINQVIDLSAFEQQGEFLEGTGSMVCDHENKIAWICRSSRSSPHVMTSVEEIPGYRAMWFNADDRRQQPIYHTNVMMSIGKKYAVVCFEAIRNRQEAAVLYKGLRQAGKEIIDITLTQTENFCGNIIELHAENNGHPVLAMSKRAWQAFTDSQRHILSDYATIVAPSLDIIEQLGGGGARCMVGEIFSPRR